MKAKSIALVFLAILLLLFSSGVYYLAIDEYITVHREVFHERPRFGSFFHGRPFVFHLFTNGPVVAAIILLLIARKKRPRRPRPISE